MIHEQASTPVPCMNCGEDIRQNYPKFAMAAIVGICASCEQKAIEAEKESLSQQIQQRITKAESFDELDLLKHSQVRPNQMSREEFQELKRKFHR